MTSQREIIVSEEFPWVYINADGKSSPFEYGKFREAYKFALEEAYRLNAAISFCPTRERFLTPQQFEAYLSEHWDITGPTKERLRELQNMKVPAKGIAPQSSSDKRTWYPHIMVDRHCTKCGATVGAVAHFKWPCIR